VSEIIAAAVQTPHFPYPACLPQ